MPTFNTAQWNGSGGSSDAGAAVSGAQLIYRALRDLGVLRAGQTASPDGMEDGLATLNELVDSWNTERLTVRTITREVFGLTGGEESYFIGDGGAGRPARIERAGFISAGSDSESSIDVLSHALWADGRQGVHNDAGMPAMIYLRPAPAAGDRIVIYAWARLDAFDMETPVELAPGYASALRWNLALDLAPSFRVSAKIDDILYARIEQNAARTKGSIKRLNIPRLLLRSDSALLTGGAFDVYSGRYR